jgi:uncharacterized protein YegL
MLTPQNSQNFLAQIQQFEAQFQTAQGTYSAEIKRDQPTAIMLLIDQSGSMASNEKAVFCAKAINNLLNEVINTSTKEGGLRDYIDVALIGYGGEKNAQFLLKDGFMNLTELSQNNISTTQIITEKEIRGKITQETKILKVWLNPVAKNATPMGEAFDLALETLENWIQKNPNSFPPVVINVSDGEQTDCKENEILERALKIKSLATNDGNLLLFNCHLAQENKNPIIFPKTREELPQDDKYALLMYDMSSTLPQKMRLKVISIINQDIPENTQIVAMGYNADSNNFVKILEVGTKTQFMAISKVV